MSIVRPGRSWSQPARTFAIWRELGVEGAAIQRTQILGGHLQIWSHSASLDLRQQLDYRLGGPITFDFEEELIDGGGFAGLLCEGGDCRSPLQAGSETEKHGLLRRSLDGSWQQRGGGKHQSEYDEETLGQATGRVVHQDDYR